MQLATAEFVYSKLNMEKNDPLLLQNRRMGFSAKRRIKSFIYAVYHSFPFCFTLRFCDVGKLDKK